MVTSRTALEGLLQNRLTATADVRCKDALRMQGNAAELFHHLYAGKHHHTDDTSSSSCGADEMTTQTALQTIKREAHTPTTDQSEDSGVDVAAGDGHGPFGRKRAQDDSDDGDGCPTAVKCGRTVAAGVLRSTDASCPPFRPWSGGGDDESSSEVGLRMFRDIRDVDRILTLTQRRCGEQCPPPPPPPPPQEPQPLDLTKGVRVGPHYTTPPPPVEEEEFPGTSVNATAAPAGSTRYGKNMSRARRIEANARERSRVHTISAAFDTLRATVPSYSRNQKLSKLSTIRIASAYILTLSRLLDMDYSAEQDSPSVAECVDNVTGIIHMEGKAKKRKDEH